jgi:hypothetical protein
MQHKIAFLLILTSFLTACGSSNSSNSDPSSGSIAGNWQMSLQPSNSKLSPRAQSGFLAQNGNNLTGSLLLTDVPCTGIGSVTGTMSGSNVSLTISPTGLLLNLTGTVGSGQTSMSGDYNILSTGCSSTNTAPQDGTWTANLIPPFNGNFTGQFSPSTGASPYSISGQLTQGSSTGQSTAPITGTLTITGFSCLASANLTGSVSGTSVVLNLVDSEGSQLGEMYATSSLDASSMSGTYKYVGQGSTGIPGCKSGSGGTFTLSLAAGSSS